MRVLVTGATGFTGTWMMDYLSGQAGVKPVGLIRHPPDKQQREVTSFQWITADLLDRKTLIEKVLEIRPDAIIHLGGLTRGTIENLLQVNAVGTGNILDAGFAANPDCRMLVISSSAVYGYPRIAPIKETTPVRPLSEYGISKIAQEAVAVLHHERNDANSSIIRPFNLAGPGQPESFICGKIIKQVTEIEQQQKTTIDLQEITSARDFVDIRDVVRGYWALLSHPEFSRNCAGQIYNMGSGNDYPVSKIIRLIEEITGQNYIVKLPAQPPKILIPSQQSDNTQILSVTGWKPQISLKDTLRDMLTAARRNP